MSAFHFLRPEYLFLLLPSALFVWWLFKQQDDESKWKKIVDPKLLKYLLVQPEGKHFKIAVPWHLAVVLFLLVLAVSGPSWKLKESPFTQDDTNIVFLLSVKESMLTTDIMPTRLSRATIKIEDLLQSRKDTRSSLIAYSGTAHLVLPLTSDHSIVKTFAQALDPSIMPLKGDNVQDALLLAQKQLNSAAATIIILTDAISPSLVQVAEKQGFKNDMNVILWQIVSSELSNVSDFNSAASLLDATTVPYAADNSDVKAVSEQIEKNFKNAQQDDSSRYEDGGYVLIPLLFLLLLLWARQGFIAELWRRS